MKNWNCYKCMYSIKCEQYWNEKRPRFCIAEDRDLDLILAEIGGGYYD